VRQWTVGEKVEVVGASVTGVISGQRGLADQHGAVDVVSENVLERPMERSRAAMRAGMTASLPFNHQGPAAAWPGPKCLAASHGESQQSGSSPSINPSQSLSNPSRHLGPFSFGCVGTQTSQDGSFVTSKVLSQKAEQVPGVPWQTSSVQISLSSQSALSKQGYEQLPLQQTPSMPQAVLSSAGVFSQEAVQVPGVPWQTSSVQISLSSQSALSKQGYEQLPLQQTPSMPQAVSSSAGVLLQTPASQVSIVHSLPSSHSESL